MSAHDKYQQAQKEDDKTAMNESVSKIWQAIQLLKEATHSVEVENKKKNPETSVIWVGQQFLIDKIIDWVGSQRINDKNVYLTKVLNSPHLLSITKHFE